MSCAPSVTESDVQEASASWRDIWNYLSTGAGYEKAKVELEQGQTKRWYKQVKAQQDDLFGPLQTPAELSNPEHPRFNWFQHEMTMTLFPLCEWCECQRFFCSEIKIG
jgi:hypothetical protein